MYWSEECYTACPLTAHSIFLIIQSILALRSSPRAQRTSTPNLSLPHFAGEVILEIFEPNRCHLAQIERVEHFAVSPGRLRCIPPSPLPPTKCKTEDPAPSYPLPWCLTYEQPRFLLVLSFLERYFTLLSRLRTVHSDQSFLGQSNR